MPKQAFASFNLIRSARTQLGSLALLGCAYLLMAASPVDAGIYKSIGPNGEIIFTDQPYEATETVKDKVSTQTSNSEALAAKNLSPEAQDAYEVEDWSVPTEDVISLTPDPIAPPAAAMPFEDDEPEVIRVSRVDILSPVHDAIFSNPDAKWIEFQSYPMPINETGLTAELWMNNQKVSSSNTFMLRMPSQPAGSHTLQVKLVDADGRLFMQSTAIQVHTTN